MKQQAMKRSMLILLLLLLTVTAAACGTKEDANGNSDVTTGAGSVETGTANKQQAGNAAANAESEQNSANTESSSGEGVEDTGTANTDQSGTPDAKEEAAIKAYFTDSDLLNLIEQVRTISYPKDDTQAKLTAAYQALQTDGTKEEVSLWKSIELLSLSFKDSTLTLDIHIPDEARLGGPGESMLLDALKKTMFQFTEVSSIELLVDGKQVDSLMGHDELPHPIVKP